MGGRVWEGCLPTLAVGYAPWRGGHLGGWGAVALETTTTPSLRAVRGAHRQRGSVWTLWVVASHELRVPREKRLILSGRQDEAENPS